MLTLKGKLALVAFVLESFFICFILYHTLLRDQINGKRQEKETEVDCEAGICDNEMSVKSKLQEYNKKQKEIWSEMNKLMMNNCPSDWPLEIVRVMTVNDPRPPAQVCRNIEGFGQWKCAPGWAAQVGDPFCVRVITKTSPTNSHQDTREADTLQETFYSYVQLREKPSLLYVYIPHTGGTAMQKSLFFNETQDSSQQDRSKEKIPVSSLQGSFYDSYHKFCVVRHPCARLISAWKNFSKGPPNFADNTSVWRFLNKTAFSSFDAFVEQLLLGGNQVDHQGPLQPQVSIIFDRNGRFLLDQVLVYEKWRESLNELGEKTHVDTSNLQSMDRNSSESSCQQMYSASTWSKMTDIYKMDFCVLGYSKYRDRTLQQKPPVITNGTYLSARFNYCKVKVERHGDKHKKAEITHEANKSTSCVIYTYFQIPPSPTQGKVNRSRETIDVWKECWSRAGWNPRVLSEKDAEGHPEYDMFRSKFLALPTINPKAYEMSCFMRHVAMAAVGGGWMTDYDVLPLHLPACSEPPNKGRYTVYEKFIPSLVSGNGDEFTRAAKLMADIDWPNHPNLTITGRPHVSDMNVLNLYAKNGSVVSMMTVINAKHYFEKPFICNKTCPQRSLTPIPPDLPELPWVIHFSHSSLGFWFRMNVTSVWPGSTWNAKNLRPIESNRPKVMKDAFDFIEATC